MTPEQQKITIAEACGWTPVQCRNCKPNKCTCDTDKPNPNTPPDYLNDLNAMHEAEKTLDDDHLYIYGNELDRITLPKTSMNMCYVHGPEAGMYPELFRATPTQRAEAFLRTIGKWEES